MGAPKSYKRFYDLEGIDKGAAKPTFCYPIRKQHLKEEVERMQRTLEQGTIPGEHKMSFELRLKERRKRLDAINEAEENARKTFEQDKDYWVARRESLKEEIAGRMPTRDDIKNRRVNPHKIMREEKTDFGEKKKEFIVLSRLMGEDSNVSFLQRDK